MAKNGNGRERVIDYLVRNLTEGRAAREFKPDQIEEGLRELNITLKEDGGHYWGYLRADDGEERWISWGEVEDNLRILYGVIPEKVISGETETEKNPSKKEEIVPLVIVAQPATEKAESLDTIISGGDQVEERVAISTASEDANLPAIRDAASLPLIPRSEPKPADELPVDVGAAAEEAEVQKINRYALLFKSLGVGVAIAAVMGLGAAVGYFVRDFYARNEPKTEIVCPAAEVKDCPEADKLTEKNKTLADKLDKIKTKVKQAEANNKYLAERKVNAENDYIEIMLSTADQGLVLAESNSALEQCNFAAKQGREDYAGLERRLEEFSMESRAKTDFLVNQSTSWYSGFSAAVTLWLDAESRYVDSLEAGKICEISWEKEKQIKPDCSLEVNSVYSEKEKVETQLADAESALAQANQVCLYAERQSSDWLAEGEAEQAGLIAKIADLGSVLEEQGKETSAAKARDQEYARERSSFISSWENEQSVALTYVDNGLAALAERDETVLRLGEHLAEAQAVFDQAEACEQREKDKEEQLNICVDEKDGWRQKYAGSQTEILGVEQKLILAKESLEKKSGDYSAFESSSKQEIDRKQTELVQLQGQLARMQEQLKIVEESTYDQKEDKSGVDLAECRSGKERIQVELSRVSGLLEDKNREYDFLVSSFGEERKKAQDQLTQVEEQLGEEKKKSQGYLMIKDRTAQEYSRCADEWDQLKTQSDKNRSELETCHDERRDALAEQTRIQSSLDLCLEENSGWHQGNLSTGTVDGLPAVCYADLASQTTTRLEDGKSLIATGFNCITEDQFRSDYKKIISKISSPWVDLKTNLIIEQTPTEKLAESSITKPAEDYFHKPVEQDLPLREENYYGQLRANPGRAEEIAL